MLRNFIAVLSTFFLFSADKAIASIIIEAPRSVKQGGVVRVAIKYPALVYPFTVALYGPALGDPIIETYPRILDENNYLALIPISLDREAGKHLICVFGENSRKCKGIEVERVDFPVADGVAVIVEQNEVKKEKRNNEVAEMEKVFANMTHIQYWNKDLRFAEPLVSMELTSPFGQVRHKRYLPKKGKAIDYDRPHYGADLRADIGTSVFAVEAGIVRIAKYFSAEGNFVVIDHGYGILSLYMHLSKIKVKQGQEIKRGELIALSGDTAAKNRPHLHMEIRLIGIAVSPWEFMREPPFARPRVSAAPSPKKRGVR